ncbi:MAG: NAD(P)H-hydrate dehydratase, partial [Actinomycetota bacterium]
GLAGPAAGLAAAAAAGPGRVVAVDLPSGVDPDTGEVGPGAVRADLTVTFGTGKPGLYVDPGAAHAGLVVVVDLGLAPELPDRPALRLAQAADVAALLPRPAPDWDKYRRGVLGVAAGSPAYTGAAVLCAGGALATGVGMVRVLADPPVAAAVRARWPEAVVTVARDETDPLAGVGRVQAWVAGPGSGTDPAAAARLSALLGTPGPLLVDADGLTVLGRLLDADPDLLRQRAGPTLLTPHAGELARLLSADRAAVEARRRAHVQEAVDRWGATVLLKGRTTLVAGPGQVPWANPTGTPWLATAGTGDVLAGMIGAFIAQGIEPMQAALGAVWLHGRAAEAYGGDV